MTPRFNVTVLAPAAEAFEALVSRANEFGLAQALMADARRILEQLATDPFGFGESREFFPSLHIHTRVGFEGRLAADYGVHEPARLVWVQRLRLQRTHG